MANFNSCSSRNFKFDSKSGIEQSELEYLSRETDQLQTEEQSFIFSDYVDLDMRKIVSLGNSGR